MSGWRGFDVAGHKARVRKLTDAGTKSATSGRPVPASLFNGLVGRNENEAVGGRIPPPVIGRGGHSGATRAGEKPAPIYPLIGMCRAAGIAEPVPEWQFHPSRKWRFDWAWPLHMLALEIDGGVWVQGRHNRGAGAIADQEKLSEAAILGWRVLYAIPDDLSNGIAMGRVLRALRPVTEAA